MTQTPTDALRLVPSMPTVELTDDMLFKIETGETVTYGELKRRLSAAPASPLPGGVWRTDFENAPDCEEGILIVDATKISPAVGTARFIDGEWCGYDHGHGVECLWPSPTHWMPLPAAPTGEAK